MIATSILFLFMCVTMLHGIALIQGRTLLEMVRDHNPQRGPLIVTVTPFLQARGVSDLLKETDLVVEGIVDRSMSRLTTDQTSIETAVDLTVTRVLFHNVKSVPVPTDAIRRVFIINPGGQLDMDGKSAVVIASGFSPLAVASRFVLFLKKMPNATEGTFLLVNGAYGVFEVVDGRVVSVVATSSTNIHAHDGSTVEAFSEMLRRLQPGGDRQD